MKKIVLLVILSFVLSTLISAQTPQFYNYNTTNAGNTFPLGTDAPKMVQWLVPPGEINQPTLAISGNITKFYCQMVRNYGPIRYTQLNIMLGQTTLTELPGGAFYTGAMDTVYKMASVTLSGTGVNWLEFTLDHPFAYDNTKSLIIQMEHHGATGESVSYIHGHTQTAGIIRTYSDNANPFGVKGQDAYEINCGIDVEATGVEPIVSSQIPQKYNLEQNYPNPFNPVTKINFDLPKSGFVTLKVYDILGQEVATLVNGTKNAGRYNVDFDGSSISSGMYFYKIESNGFVATRKMMLIK
jgi:hypothetical protein